MFLGDRVPGADRPVVPAVGVAVLLGAGEEEDGRALRLHAGCLHRLGGEQLVGDRAGVVETGTEVRVEMGREKDRGERRVAALEDADDVVAHAAVLGERDRDLAVDRGHDGLAAGELLLEPVAVLPGDVDHRHPVVVVLAIVGAEGLRVRVPRVGAFAVGHDDAGGLAQRGLGADEVQPPVIELAVDQHPLAGHVARCVEVVLRAGADVHELALERPVRAGDAGEGRGDDRCVARRSPTVTRAPSKSQASTGTASSRTSVRPMAVSSSRTYQEASCSAHVPARRNPSSGSVPRALRVSMTSTV